MYEDSNANCCNILTTDCLGQCSGDAFEGLLGNDARVFVPDCAGGCYGNARVDRCGICEGFNEAEDACGVCFGNATACSEPEVGKKHDEPSGGSRALRAVDKQHPWLAAFVAAELVATSLCLIICATQRNSRRGPHQPSATIRRPTRDSLGADLEVLVEDHLASIRRPRPPTAQNKGNEDWRGGRPTAEEAARAPVDAARVYFSTGL